MEHTGQSPDEKPVKQRKTKEEPPPSPALRRQGDRPGAGADTPSGPAARRSTEAAKRERKKQDEIKDKDRRARTRSKT